MVERSQPVGHYHDIKGTGENKNLTNDWIVQDGYAMPQTDQQQNAIEGLQAGQNVENRQIENIVLPADIVTYVNSIMGNEPVNLTPEPVGAIEASLPLVITPVTQGFAFNLLLHVLEGNWMCLVAWLVIFVALVYSLKRLVGATKHFLSKEGKDSLSKVSRQVRLVWMQCEQKLSQTQQHLQAANNSGNRYHKMQKEPKQTNIVELGDYDKKAQAEKLLYDVEKQQLKPSFVDKMKYLDQQSNLDISKQKNQCSQHKQSNSEQSVEKDEKVDFDVV